MDIQFYGANTVAISNKQARIVVDNNLADLGGKSVSKSEDVALYTSAHSDPNQKPKILIDQPGEFEVSGISIYGIPARAHMDEEGQKTATMFKLLIDDIRVLVTGHVYPELTDKQLETIGMIDIMIVPVGGNGFTLDGVGALKLIKKVEPKIVIPTHFEQSGLNFEVSQQSLEMAIKALAMEPKEPVAKLKIKPADLPPTTQLVILETGK